MKEENRKKGCKLFNFLNLQLYTCDYCSETSTQRRQFSSHLMTEHPGQVYRCDQCNKNFFNGETWRTHRCKADQWVFDCNYCDNSFGHLSQLTRHMRSHEEKSQKASKYKHQQVPCDQCDATFHSAFYLKQHQLVHTGETPHACKLCSRRFRNKCNLLRHVRTIHKEADAKFSEL